MKNEKLNERRVFLKKMIALGGVMAVAPQVMYANNSEENFINKGGDGFTFLFQGDSITDGNRTRNNDWNHVMGHGYQYIIASKLWYDFPSKDFHFFNRGISGNKVSDLAARWQKDTLDIKPGLLSILIGINDASTFLNGDKGFTVERYENEYRALLQQTKQHLPNVQLVLCEPFILPVGKVKDNREAYLNDVQQRQEVVKTLALENNAIHVEFQKAFNKALSKAPAEYWIWDGIHPMPAGHELMAREWIKQVSKKLKFIKS